MTRRGAAGEVIWGVVTVARTVPRPGAAAAGASAPPPPPPPPPKRVVITGGSRGFGYALARECLAAGDRVVICGRDAGRLAAALAALRADFGAAAAGGAAADCSRPGDVRRLGELAEAALGGVDILVNGAGEVTAKKLLSDVDPEEIVRVVGSNVVGSLLGSRESVRLMLKQPAAERPVYHVFNCGFSKWGAKFTKSAVTHKATKTALTQLSKSLADELREAGVTSIGVHNLSPGMMLTDLLLRDSTPAARRFFNALAEEPETVAAVLAPRVRSASGSGGGVDYLTPAGAALRVLGSVPQIVGGGRFFDREGRRVRAPGEEYQDNGVRVQLRR
ncbi:MAG: NAD(P)-binding protein [Monoraphidium minutum]|nr:MAG: NAD(P)-binding protein [Monoraphidium minutum]